jgi:hypothetical protein
MSSPWQKPGLLDEMGASELWSALLGVVERRAAERTPAQLLAQYERDRFVQPANVDQRTQVAIDGHMLAAAAAFEAIELAPVAPLGTCSVVGLASQNKVLSALRGTEVVSDTTNVMALECARRLRADPAAHVRLATSQRVVRAQQVPKLPGYTQHFRLFTLASAARERKDHAFVVEALAEHIRTLLAVLDRLEAHGYAFPERVLHLRATPARAGLADRIAAAVPLAALREPLDHAYYHGLRYLIGVRGPDGSEIPLIDGGAFDWLAKLTSNRRLVFVASGMGAGLVPLLFRRT